MTRLLVTTALEETWGGHGQAVYFLGEWCRLYGRKHVWSEVDAKIQPHHWNDRKKLKHDHDHLKALYEKVLGGLAAKLNHIHGVEKSDRYWRIVVGPWLINYLQMLFDKWEVLRLAFLEQGTYETHAIEQAISVPRDYNEFMEILFLTDLWNHQIFLRILKFQYQEKVSYLPVGLSTVVPAVRTLERQKKSSFRWKLVRPMDVLSSCLAGKRTRVLFYRSYFKFPQLALINCSLLQVPSLHLNAFGKQFEAEVDRTRRQDIVELAAESDFEHFLSLSLLQDIPASYLESYSDFASSAADIPFDPKVIVTATGHWGDELFKIWMAEKVTNSAKLVVVDHGGSLPPLFDIFEHDEHIADSRATWFVPLREKEVQLPPSKLVGFKIVSNFEFCSVIGLEQPRYSSRATAYPIVEQTLDCLDSTLLFCRALAPRIFNNLKVKPSPNRGWETEKRYVDALGQGKVYEERNYYKVLSSSRLVVCTYSDTTFAEAMASGVPTILVHRPEFYEKVAEAHHLIAALTAANIVFDDAIKAAEHVNSIWDTAVAWWAQPDVVAARDLFYQMTCNIKSAPSAQRSRWVSFLNTLPGV